MPERGAESSVMAAEFGIRGAACSRALECGWDEGPATKLLGVGPRT